MKAKGIPKSALARKNFDDYFAMCVQAHEEDVEFRRIASFAHRIVHMSQSKRGLSCNNDKVFLLDAFTARPLGHHLNSIGHRSVSCEDLV